MGQGYNCAPLKGVCPSGQRERAVNPSAQPTEVRILPPPFRKPGGSGCEPSTWRSPLARASQVLLLSESVLKARVRELFAVGVPGGAEVKAVPAELHVH